MKRKLTVLLLVVVGILIVATVLVMLITEKPPQDDIAAAREAISEAQRLQADIYSPKLFSEAESNYAEAMVLWSSENDRFYVIRRFGRVKMLAKEAYKAAKMSQEDAMLNSSQLKSNLKERLDKLKIRMMEFQPTFSKLPLPRSVREENNKGRLHFAEAEIAFREGGYMVCDEKLRSADGYITSSYRSARLLLDDYFESFDLWKQWIDQTIRDSRSGRSNAIIVDKFSRKLHMYKSGNHAGSFDIELGNNWIGDKQYKGDKATPEGLYMIIQRKQNGGTRYYKAFLLDYPNGDDKKRFTREKNSGRIPHSSEIGGMIEIHGEGGKGADWTDGCIALHNSDMDKLFAMGAVGTRVTIVGSMVPIDELIK